MSTPEEVDLVVVGAGPGGESLALAAASAGLRTFVVDKHLVGGECPYYACIPTKMMLRAAETLTEAGRANELAGEVTVRPDWARVAHRLDTEATDGWSDEAAVDRLVAAGAEVMHGIGRISGPGQVSVTPADGGAPRVVRASRGVVLNPGTRPAVPDLPGLAEAGYLTNREAVRLTALPGSLVVLGGGPVAVELAQAFARFGVAVTIAQRGERLLPRDEPEASGVVTEALRDDGVTVMTNAAARSVTGGDEVTVTFEDGREASAAAILVATGRRPNLEDLGLDVLGLDPAGLEVDDQLRVMGASALWLIGDAAGRGAFTHVSTYQANIVRRQLLDEDRRRADYRALPHVTFTEPEVAGVGLTEQAARAAGLAVATGQADLGSRGFTHGPGANGLVKLVADADRGVLVGATAVGPYAGEVLSMLTLAVHAEIPLETMSTMIYAYPTFHRAVATALAQLPADLLTRGPRGTA
ncbi:MAG: NAD(P)/FAD-dependent oxidoreductase [Nocardioides sp.]|uniref:dihydrolipoyl dehydrogenase family protein n=1 Tax=Nocardioides sp. TaxID=35761 RepID=UPI0039E381AC